MNDTRPTWTNTQQVIAFSLVLSFILVIFVWMLFPPKAVDQSVMTVLNMLLGALVAKFTTVVDYFLGSSQGSKDKDASQNKILETLTRSGSSAAVTAAAALAAPPAAAVAAPPAAEEAAPAAAEKALRDELKRNAPV